MKRAIVVGSGAGGAAAAKALQGAFEVTVLEAGGEFRPFSLDLAALEKWKKTGLFFDERETRLFFPAMKIRKVPDMVLVNGRGTGGTTTIATGNALRMDRDLIKLGIDLEAEFEEISREIPISTEHEKGWGTWTRRLFETCREMGLSPRPTPKMGHYGRCRHCGRCVLGCPHDVKWDSRQFLKEALAKGARLKTGCAVHDVIIANGKVTGVRVDGGWKKKILPADLVILAAGGFGTPVILERSGIGCSPRLFVDPVLCVAAECPDSRLNGEVSMPFIVAQENFIVSPYFDFLSFFFNRRWRRPGRHILSLMIKLADENTGSVSAKGILKRLTEADKKRLAEGISLCSEILFRLGAEKDRVFLGTVNAGHPGGMLPLTEQEAVSFHHASLPENLYVADASLFPKSLGNPPILTIIAMAKRVSKMCLAKFA